MIRKFVILLLIGVFIYVFLYVNNNWLTVSNYTVHSDEIPQSFDGFRILQVSDLHDATFGENQQHLVNKIQQQNPHIIVITGDLVDSNRYNLQNSMDLIDRIVEIADVYYVTGNHEVATNDVDHIKQELTARGVRVLSNESLNLVSENTSISLTGIEDPLMGNEAPEMLAASKIPEDMFTVLLAHRTEDFQAYVDAEIDLTLAGHAHGGQVRIPFIGGLIAPAQGFFPSYTSGLHEFGESKLIISRGLGNSIIPYRIFNLPELVVITLKSSPMD